MHIRDIRLDVGNRGFGFVDYRARFLQLRLDGAVELVAELAGRSAEVIDRFADLTHDLGQLGRPEHDQRQDHYQHDLQRPHAEDVHRARLCRPHLPSVD